MAEQQQKEEKAEKKAKQEPKSDKFKEIQEKKKQEQQYYESLIRVSGYDLPGNKNIYTALTRIKGISWAVSNAICHKLGFPPSKKVSELSKDEIKKIESFLENANLPDFLKNRRLDPETGKTEHLFGSDLEITRDFDIKRLKKIKSYRGIRHAAKLPVRGQRTRSHFRTKKTGGASGIKRKSESATKTSGVAK
jgi:small subunit ribosomal protein S13